VRRALRWMWNAATCASVLLLAAVVVLWVRSDTTIDGWYWDGGRGAYDLRAVRSGLGEIQYANERGGYPVVLVPFRQGFATEAVNSRSTRHLGVPYPIAGKTTLWGPLRHERVNTYWYSVTVQDLALVILFAVLPAFQIVCFAVSLFYRVRQPGGVCRGCGYDLRATPDRCPECGLVVQLPQSRTV
jgi:hypothetical protein